MDKVVNTAVAAQCSNWEGFMADFLSKKQTVEFRKNQVIYSQGDQAHCLFFIKAGRVKLSVVSSEGKEATISMLGSNEFFGMGCLSQQKQRLTTATALEPTTVIRLEKDRLVQALHDNPRFMDLFLTQLLNRTLNLQKDLCTQILDSSEKRLVHVLMKLSENKDGHQERVIVPRISHDTLASMVGTTRSRVTFFMNKFKKLGFIAYGNGILVNPSRLASALQED